MNAPVTGGFGFTAQGWTYNPLGQMSGYTVSPTPGSPIHVSYNYGSAAAAGKLESMTRIRNGISTTVNYAYDGLGRLTTASATHWSQSFTYDGFGTLREPADQVRGGVVLVRPLEQSV